MGLLILLLVSRTAALWHFRTDLNADPDAYLAIARNIAAGNGLTATTLHDPTAFRPPLYPLLLAPISGPSQQLPRALLHLGLSLITFLAIWRTGLNLGLSRWQVLIANLLFTMDPLALRYVAFPMTETLCACLASLLMMLLTERQDRWFLSLGSGLLFGLCVVSRPTFWAFGALYAPLWTAFHLWQAKSGRQLILSILLTLTGVSILVGPWIWRNARSLHVPIVMTTHGGYTLLLGNNTAFYREVVDQPWGTIWDGSHGAGQSAWYDRTLTDAARDNIRGEVELDRWMSRRAWQTIFHEPFTCLRACLLKFCWFWNIGPQGPQAREISRATLWSIRAFYLLFWTAALTGLGKFLLSPPWFSSGQDSNPSRPSCRENRLWWVPVLLIASLSCVHLLYWSDARMRAPITPAIALLAASAGDWSARKRPQQTRRSSL